MNYTPNLTARITFAQAAQLPCRYFTGVEGSCTRGSTCWFSHTHALEQAVVAADEEVEFSAIVLAERQRALLLKREPTKAAKCERRRADRPAKLEGRARKREIVRAVLGRKGKSTSGREVGEEIKRWEEKLGLGKLGGAGRYVGLKQVLERPVEAPEPVGGSRGTGYGLEQARGRLVAEWVEWVEGRAGASGSGPAVQMQRDGCRNVGDARQMLRAGYDPVASVPERGIGTRDAGPETLVKQESEGVIVKQEHGVDEDVVMGGEEQKGVANIKKEE